MSIKSPSRSELLHKLGETNAEYIALVYKSADPQQPTMIDLRRTRFDLMMRLLEAEEGASGAGSK